ncbi:uncharacterized protein LOC110619934 isoform X1 [Manihot esculenta]|uniref:uncharacterized protein LOC110619934 isoform X1 n=2 Tax=Manihot esculenta TaxID=3983 RepID=UPI001CC6D927|nr:uncharacterized protein LOC110619934 isoform X1 [Manihot esculenta]
MYMLTMFLFSFLLRKCHKGYMVGIWRNLISTWLQLIYKEKIGASNMFSRGWKEFAKSKKLAIGDVLVFLRGESGDLLVGLKKLMKQDTDCKLPVISSENMCIGVLAGAHSAINYGTRFSFIYKPRPKKCEFMVDVNKYLKAQNYNLSIGTRFSMKFEAEEVMEQSFTGSIVGFHDNASSRWAGSEWRYIKVQWDKPSTFFPERVSPWELELSSNSQMSQRSKRAQPNNTVDFTQYVPCQRRKTDRQLKESCSHVYEKESNYGVEGKDYVDASEANKEGEIQVSESDIVSLQKSSDPAETNICDDIECLFRESDYIDACEFPWAESPPSLHHEAIALPSTEFENLPLAARTPTSSLGVLHSECAFLPSCKTNGILPTECENSLRLLPQVASTSHGDMTETSYMHCFKRDFHGFQVWHHLIPYLGWFSVKMGDFWNDARIQRADTVSSVLNGLGEALCLKDRNWESLNRDELEKLINGINDSLIAGFKLDCLKPIALKAEGVLKAREQCDSLQSRRSSLESQLRELDSERQNVVGELQNVRQGLRSLTEGFVYESML